MANPIDQPDWRALVLAHLTGTDLTTGDLAAVDNADGWRLAYATLMAMRGKVEPPELLADLVQRVGELEHRIENDAKTAHVLNGITSESMDSLRQRLARIEQAATTGGSVPR